MSSRIKGGYSLLRPVCCLIPHTWLFFESTDLRKNIKYRFRVKLVIMPTETFRAEMDQSCSKLRRRRILLLCLPIERVHGVTQLSEAVLLDVLSSALPQMHTHFWSGCVGKGSSSSSQVVKTSDCPVFHKFYCWILLLYSQLPPS